MNQIQALPHAEEPEAGVPVCLDIEPGALVRDGEPQRTRFRTELHRDRARATVLDRILQSLLGDAEQAEQTSRDTLAGTPDVKTRSLTRAGATNFTAQTIERGDQTEYSSSFGGWS